MLDVSHKCFNNSLTKIRNCFLRSVSETSSVASVDFVVLVVVVVSGDDGNEVVVVVAILLVAVFVVVVLVRSFECGLSSICD